MKTTWKYYPSSNSVGHRPASIFYVCTVGGQYAGQYTVFADGRITAHSRTHNKSITDIINELEARKFIMTGVLPICKPPVVTTALVVVPKQQTLLPLTQEQEIIRQQRLAGGDDDEVDDLDEEYYKTLRGY